MKADLTRKKRISHVTRNRFAKVGAVLAAFALLLAGVGTHAALAATVVSTTFGCSSFTITGTSASSAIYQEVDGGGVALASQVTPIVGGIFSATVTFAGQSAGTVLTYMAIEEVTPGTIVGGHIFANSATACIGAASTWSGTGMGPATGPDSGLRLNTGNAAPPFGVYCFNGGVSIWTIDHLTGYGTLAFTATPVQIGTALAQATNIGQNVEIDALWGASLWALSSNQLQAHWAGQGSPYDFIFASTTCGPVYAAVTNSAAPPPVTYWSAPGYSPGSAPIYAPGTYQTTYVVQPGDDLYQISRQFHVSVQAIAAANGITNYNFIFAGEVLNIP
jgi:hypothetical protein